MIRHVVFFRLTDRSLLPKWKEETRKLSEIETVRNFSVNDLLKPDRFDCALYMEFESEEDLRYYQDHPIHQRYLSEALPGIEKDKFVADLLP